MMKLKPTTTTVLLIVIGVHQMCTASPISANGQTGTTRPLTANQLHLARNAGISDQYLFVAEQNGLNFDEIIRSNSLLNGPRQQDVSTLNVMTEICEILDNSHKTASDSTSVQLKKLLTLMPLIADFERLIYMRAAICNYLSKPQSVLNVYTPASLTGEKYRLLKAKVYTATGMKRVKSAKRMCCLGRGGDFVLPTQINDLTDKEMNEFDEIWANYRKSIGSLQQICDFFESKYPNDTECHLTESSELSDVADE